MPNPSESTVLQPREKQALQQEGTRPGLVFRPDVDILEHPDAFVIHADLPGTDESRVQIRLEKGVLSLDAQPIEPPEAGWRPVHAEYRSGAYHREFRVFDEIDADHVAAKLRDGVLELRLPKAEKRRARTIAIQAG